MFDQKGDVEDHVPSVSLLSDFAIDGGSEAEVHGIGDISGVDKKRTEGCGVIAAFDTKVGAVVVFEIVADGVVVGDSVTGNEVIGILARDRPGSFPNDNGEFTFVMHVSDSCGAASLT